MFLEPNDKKGPGVACQICYCHILRSHVQLINSSYIFHLKYASVHFGYDGITFCGDAMSIFCIYIFLSIYCDLAQILYEMSFIFHMKHMIMENSTDICFWLIFM